MKTLREILSLSTEYLQKHNIDAPRRQAEAIIGHVLKLERIGLYMDMDRPLNEQELQQCRVLLKRRGEGEPFAYIVSQVEFFGVHIRVERHVIIPRQETEILADKIARHLSREERVNKTLLDVCCGSGCIGISLKKKFPDLNVILTDMSEEALDIARTNAKENQVEISFLNGDLYQPFLGKRAHWIVCNPPYISQDEYEQLDREVKNYEPKSALLSGPSGVEFYERLAVETLDYLHPGGWIWMEIGSSQGERVKALFETRFWQSASVSKDWAGHDRFVTVQRS